MCPLSIICIIWPRSILEVKGNFQLLYLHLTRLHCKGQRQGHAHLNCAYLIKYGKRFCCYQIKSIYLFDNVSNRMAQLTRLSVADFPLFTRQPPRCGRCLFFSFDLCTQIVWRLEAACNHLVQIGQLPFIHHKLVHSNQISRYTLQNQQILHRWRFDLKLTVF